jgi:phage baseplate assembly protein W
MSYVDFPFQFDGRGRTRTTDRDEHVRDLIKLVLFTSPGERVNRPDFGCGLRDLVFAPASEALVAAVQFQVHAALQRWLAEVVEVHDVTVAGRDSELAVTVTYTRLDVAEATRDVLTASIGGPGG